MYISLGYNLISSTQTERINRDIVTINISYGTLGPQAMGVKQENWPKSQRICTVNDADAAEGAFNLSIAAAAARDRNRVCLLYCKQKRLTLVEARAFSKLAKQSRAFRTYHCLPIWHCWLSLLFLLCTVVLLKLSRDTRTRHEMLL